MVRVRLGYTMAIIVWFLFKITTLLVFSLSFLNMHVSFNLSPIATLKNVFYSILGESIIQSKSSPDFTVQI